MTLHRRGSSLEDNSRSDAERKKAFRQRCHDSVLPGEGYNDTCWNSPQPFDILFWNVLDFRACAFLFLPRTGSFVRADPAVNLRGHSLIRL